MTTKTIDGPAGAPRGPRPTHVDVPAALAARTAGRARGVRRRRRVAGGVGVLVLAAASFVPLGTDWLAGGGDGGTNPSDGGDGQTSTDLWLASLPGLDLPQGEPLATPYTVGDVVHLDGAEITLAEPAASMLGVPGGLVVETGHATGSVSALATSLFFVRADGVVETIDAGFIAGSAASVQADGSVRVVYGWLATATATTGEIRVRVLGSAEAPKIIPVDPPANVRGMDGSDALIGYLTEVGAQQSRLDLETGTLESLADPGTVGVEGVTAGGLVVTWDNDSQCLAARGPDGENAWERCDGTFSYGLSPDRRWIAAPEGGLDAETGEQVSTFAGLPQRGELVAVSVPDGSVRRVGDRRDRDLPGHVDRRDHGVHDVGPGARRRSLLGDDRGVRSDPAPGRPRRRPGPVAGAGQPTSLPTASILVGRVRRRGAWRGGRGRVPRLRGGSFALAAPHGVPAHR